MSKTYRILMWVLTLTAFAVAVDSHVKMIRMSEIDAAKPGTAVVSPLIEIPPTLTRIVTVTVVEAAVPVLQNQTTTSDRQTQTNADQAQGQAELEKTKKMLAARESEVAKLQALLTGTNTSRRAFLEARMDARMEQLKTEDPVRYAETLQQRTNFLQNVQAQAASRADFLNSVDTSNMDDDQLANHNQLVQLTQRVQTLVAQLPTLTPGTEEYTAVRAELQQSRPALATLYQNERAILLHQTAQAIGYTTPDQQIQFVTAIQTIYDQTRLPPGIGRGGPPGSNPAGATGTATGNTPAPPPTK